MSNENRKGIACGGQWIIDRIKLVDHTTGSIKRWQEIIKLKEQYPFRK